MNAAISRLSLFSDNTMLSAVPSMQPMIDEVMSGRPDCCFCGSRPDTPAESMMIYECPPIGKDYYIKSMRREKQYFWGMGTVGRPELEPPSLSPAAARKKGNPES